MLCKCLKWRIETNVADIIAKGDVGLGAEDKDFARQGPAAKAFAAGMTDNLMPIIYIHVNRHVSKDQGADTMTKFVISCAESFRSIVRYPMDKIVIVFDLTGFGMKNMDWHTLLTIISILEAYYPETLYRLYIYSAPWIFQGIWKALAPMLDAHVRAKIVFVNKPADMDLIPLDRLESKMGGNLVDPMEWTPPSASDKPALLRADPKRRKYWSAYMEQAKAFEEVTERWVASDGQDDAIMEERHFMALKLRRTFLSIAPYLCASSMYTRAGIIRKDFALEWTYKQKDGRVIKHVVGEDTAIPRLDKLIAAREGKSGGRQSSSRGTNEQDQGAAAVGATQSRSRGNGGSSRASRSANEGEPVRRRSRTGRASQDDAAPRRRTRSGAEEQPRSSNLVKEQPRPRRSRNTESSSSHRSRDVGAGVAAGVGAGAAATAAGAAARTSSSRNNNSRPDLSYVAGPSRSRAGSSSASIFSSASEDDVYVDAEDFMDDQHGADEDEDDAYGDEQTEDELEDDDDDVIEDEEDDPVAAPVPTSYSENQPSGERSSRRRRGAPRPMVGENEQLAGFRNLAPEAHEQIAESNEKMREPFDPNQKRAKSGLLSRLNCCSAKNID